MKTKLEIIGNLMKLNEDVRWRSTLSVNLGLRWKVGRVKV